MKTRESTNISALNIQSNQILQIGFFKAPVTFGRLADRKLQPRVGPSVANATRFPDDGATLARGVYG